MHTHGFTDQPWVRMTGYQVLFLCVYELRWRQSINYTKKKDNIKPRWLNKLGQKRIFYMEKHTISFMWHSPSKRHLGCSDNQSQWRIWFILLTEPLYYVNNLHTVSKLWLFVSFSFVTSDSFLILMTSVLGLGNITESEKLNLEAITKIHFHLDDDRNGKVDLSESNEVSA